MNRFRADLGDPDIKIAGLEIWVHGREYPDLEDYWDGNWTNISARCTAMDATVWVGGSILHLSEVEHLMTTSQALYDSLEGEASLPCIEPYLSVVLKAGGQGQIEMTVEITPDHIAQAHRFVFVIDQSHLPELISDCRKVLAKYPVRNAT